MIQYINIKNDDQFVKSSYDMPITNHIYYKVLCDISKVFEGIVNHNTMEMIEAGDFASVLTSFTHTSDSIIESFKKRKILRISELISDENNIDKIQLIKSHLEMLDERLHRYASSNKCICCNQIHKELYILKCCQTLFCGECFNDKSCVLCKTADTNKILVLDDIVMFNEINQNGRNMTKVQTILNIIGDCSSKKILIFSNFNESFTVLKKFLEEKQINFLELRGTKEKRDNTIDLYKTGNVNVLLLNTIHSGAGLNLQETTDIIIYHRLHEYQKTQVLGRANRIGRKMNLNVHYLE
jgi:SNF2 family DNA or RNA helicase